MAQKLRPCAALPEALELGSQHPFWASPNFPQLQLQEIQQSQSVLYGCCVHVLIHRHIYAQSFLKKIVKCGSQVLIQNLDFFRIAVHVPSCPRKSPFLAFSVALLRPVLFSRRPTTDRHSRNHTEEFLIRGKNLSCDIVPQGRFL